MKVRCLPALGFSAFGKLTSIQESQPGNPIELHEDPPAMVKLMLRYMYTLGYDPDDADAVSAGFAPLVVHVHMYILGDLYDIPPLRALAASKMSESIESAWNHASFMEAIELVYDRTPDTDPTLRDIMLGAAVKHASELLQPDSENYEKLKKIGGEFGIGLASRLSRLADPKWTCFAEDGEKFYVCEECDGHFMTKMEEDKEYVCPRPMSLCASEPHRGAYWDEHQQVEAAAITGKRYRCPRCKISFVLAMSYGSGKYWCPANCPEFFLHEQEKNY